MDIVREGYDCIVRVGALSDSSLIQRKLTELKRGTFASPSYLTKFGTPATPEDLENGHRMVDMLAPNMPSVAPLAFQIDGRVRKMLLLTVITVTGAETNVASACAGLGIIQVPRYRVVSELAKGRHEAGILGKPGPFAKDLVAGLALPPVFVFDLGRGDDALRQTQKGLRLSRSPLSLW
ncbi:LysR substrate binding domain-containing protein [Rhizobium mongolense subsp. loessense]|uniref:LysR substrate binding domain-containing protein n=2 Tax=Rhizobium mongolense TaxID=57676 RepID=A0A1G4QA34_9HYPH|nr:LysR substrate binding domain-containing protein [Rhizobium mongolense subsp. loessense]